MEYIQNLLKDKKIALFVTGSIAIYKSLELIRLFTKSGAKVRVVMSDNAMKFITPLSFEALSRNVVLNSNTESWTNENNHIDIGKWADIGVIAPCSANTINSIAGGSANTILLSSILAFDKKIIVAMSANTKMLENNKTKSSIKLLQLSNYIFVHPVSKTLICNDFGSGAMADVKDIFLFCARELLREEYFSDRKAVVTGGGTIESIDDVRYISNFSSGKMGYYMSLALFLKGVDVCYIHTTNMQISIFHSIKVSSSLEMKKFIDESVKFAKLPIIVKPSLDNDIKEPQSISKTPILFMSSAVSDYIPKFPQIGKIKKKILGDEYDLSLVRNIDILDSIDKENIYVVGFKAEMDAKNAMHNAKSMLKDKNLSGVILNVLKDKTSFGSENIEFDFVLKDKIINLDRKHKLLNALEILDNISKNELIA